MNGEHVLSPKGRAARSSGKRAEEGSGAKDSGLYIIWLQLGAPCRVRVGALGELSFDTGVYAYVGSAQRNRSARIRRHLRREKPLRWHFDYLRPHGSVLAVSLADGAKTGECELAARLLAEANAAIAHPRFGASDCRCPAHLLQFASVPDVEALDKRLAVLTLQPDEFPNEWLSET